jgi:hypothetical protein
MGCYKVRSPRKLSPTPPMPRDKMTKAILNIVTLAASIHLATCSMAWAVNPASWTFKEEIPNTVTSKTWNSPTAIDLGKMVWEYNYNIVKITGTVSIPLFGDFTQDITSSIDPALRTGSGETTNLPAVIVSDSLSYPDTGTTATILIEIDSLGFGRAQFDDIHLGSIDIPLAGNRPIKRMNIEATISVVGYDFGDFNRDGLVDAADYTVWRDGLGNAYTEADYDVWKSHFGQLAGSGAGAKANSVAAEPATLLPLIIAVASWCLRRGRIE